MRTRPAKKSPLPPLMLRTNMRRANSARVVGVGCTDKSISPAVVFSKICEAATWDRLTGLERVEDDKGDRVQADLQGDMKEVVVEVIEFFS